MPRRRKYDGYAILITRLSGNSVGMGFRRYSLGIVGRDFRELAQLWSCAEEELVNGRQCIAFAASVAGNAGTVRFYTIIMRIKLTCSSGGIFIASKLFIL